MFILLTCSVITLSTCLIFNYFQTQKINILTEQILAQKNLIANLKELLLIKNTNGQTQNSFVFFAEKLVELSQNQDQLNLKFKELFISQSTHLSHLNDIVHWSSKNILGLAKFVEFDDVKAKKCITAMVRDSNSFLDPTKKIGLDLSSFDLIPKSDFFLKQLINSEYNSNLVTLELKKIGLDFVNSDLILTLIN